MRVTAIGSDLSRRTAGRPDSGDGHKSRSNKSRVRKVRSSRKDSAPAASAQDAEVSARIEGIRNVWSRGAGNSIELARVIWDARRQLPFGQWEQLVKLLPFSKRKANMLVTIGKGFYRLPGQTFAQLPTGWSILYQLAQLESTAFDKLLRRGVIHPKLTLQAARELLARFKGRRTRRTLRRADIKHRLRQFRDFIRRTLNDWQAKERELAEKELTRLLELIRGDGDDRTGRRPGQRTFTTRRRATLHSAQQPVTTL